MSMCFKVNGSKYMRDASGSSVSVDKSDRKFVGGCCLLWRKNKMDVGESPTV